MIVLAFSGIARFKPWTLGSTAVNKRFSTINHFVSTPFLVNYTVDVGEFDSSRSESLRVIHEQAQVTSR
jgi:hypothetical protein